MSQIKEAKDEIIGLKLTYGIAYSVERRETEQTTRMLRPLWSAKSGA